MIRPGTSGRCAFYRSSSAGPDVLTVTDSSGTAATARLAAVRSHPLES